MVIGDPRDRVIQPQRDRSPQVKKQCPRGTSGGLITAAAMLKGPKKQLPEPKLIRDSEGMSSVNKVVKKGKKDKKSKKMFSEELAVEDKQAGEEETLQKEKEQPQQQQQQKEKRDTRKGH